MSTQPSEDWKTVESVVRFTRLRDELKPVPIYPVRTGEPIRPDWAAITHGVTWSRRVPEGHSGFNLCFLLDDGSTLATEQFATLKIALDLAE